MSRPQQLPPSARALAVLVIVAGGFITWKCLHAGAWMFGVLFGVVGPALSLFEWRRLRSQDNAAAAADGLMFSIFWFLFGLVLLAERLP